MRNLLASLFLTIIVATFASAAYAQWQTDGVPLCTAGGPKYFPVSVSDGSGAIVIWVDTRYNAWDIYAQRVNAAGVPQWMADGVAINTNAPSVFESYSPPVIAPDGSAAAYSGALTTTPRRSPSWSASPGGSRASGPTAAGSSSRPSTARNPRISPPGPWARRGSRQIRRCRSIAST